MPCGRLIVHKKPMDPVSQSTERAQAQSLFHLLLVHTPRRRGSPCSTVIQALSNMYFKLSSLL